MFATFVGIQVGRSDGHPTGIVDIKTALEVNRKPVEATNNTS